VVRDTYPIKEDFYFFKIIYKIERISPGRHSTTFMAHNFKNTDDLVVKAHEMIQEACND